VFFFKFKYSFVGLSKKYKLNIKNNYVLIKKKNQIKNNAFPKTVKKI